MIRSAANAFAAVSWNMPGAVVPRANAMCSCTLASTGVFWCNWHCCLLFIELN